MARTGWGAMGYEITTGSNDATKIISKDRWNLPIDKGAGILGFTAQTEVGHATSIVPSKSVLILSGSVETGLFGLADSEQYDVLWVFTSGTVALTNQTSTVDANGQIVGLGSASTITLSQTIPKIFIRRTVGSYDAWIEYGGGASVSANDLTGTTLASGVITSSLTTVGTIGTGTWQGTAVADTYLGTGINANKIADGTVTSTEFQYLGDVTSLVQAQIDGKSATAGNGSLVTVGALDSGSITSGFGTIDTGSSTITTTGAVATGAITAGGTITGNVTGALTGNADTVTTNADLTGDVTSSGNATTIATSAVDIAMLSATGTASGTTFLCGDNTWKVAGGDDTPWTVVHDFDTYYYDMQVQTKPADPSADNGRFYVKEVDSDNDGVFCIIRKNGAFEETQIV